MQSFSEHVRLEAAGAGSAPAGSPAAEVAPDERIAVTVVMRPGAAHDEAAVGGLMGATAPAERDHLDLEALEQRRATRTMDVAAVEAFAARYRLEVSDRHPERQTLTLAGTAADMTAAFKVTLARYRIEGTEYRVRTGPIHVPAELADVIVAVLGFDERPQAIPHIRRASPALPSLQPFTPIEVAGLYGFPAGTTGSGQTVAILELGGGFDQADLNTYFDTLGVHPPAVVGVSVDGAQTGAGVDTGADGEVQLDIDVVGSVAPGATMVVYFAPNTARGFLDALKAAVHNPDHRPCAISISWGMAEEQWSAQARTQMDTAFHDAGLLGITVTAASGDDGSTDNLTQGAPHTDYPAASPWTLGCGGTVLEASGGAISSERTWDDLAAGGGATGGGISSIYPVPDWQAAANTVVRDGSGAGGRGVPDVAGNASPSSGYRVRVDGQDQTVGGTSAVAPLWAALVARMTEAMGTSIGFMNPLVYQGSSAAGVRDVTDGGNGAYAAGPGWDPCTGLGSPVGEALLTALRGGVAASQQAGR